MLDHLFDKKKYLNLVSKKAVEQIKNISNMEEEIMFYIKLGMDGRAKNFDFAKVPHLEFVLNICSNFDADKFGQNICGYYKRVNLVKKRLYEEIS